MLVDKITGAALIPLHSYKYPGLVALTDAADYELVKDYRWYPNKSHNTFYAQTNTFHSDGRPTTLRMHKLITGFAMTDHEDRNGLNCQRYNLRDANPMQNQANQGKRPGSSRFKGICWDKSRGKWLAQIQLGDRKRKHLGYFDDEIAGARTYDAAAVKHFGEFALTNEMLGLYDSVIVVDLAA